MVRFNKICIDKRFYAYYSVEVVAPGVDKPCPAGKMVLLFINIVA